MLATQAAATVSDVSVPFFILEHLGVRTAGECLFVEGVRKDFTGSISQIPCLKYFLNIQIELSSLCRHAG